MQLKMCKDGSGSYVIIDPEGYVGEYVVIRNPGSSPENMFDGEDIFSGPVSGKQVDRKILGGKDYYYAVETNDNPFQVFGPFRQVEGYDNVLAISNDSCIILSFNVPESAIRTKIFKSDGGDFSLFRDITDSGTASLEDTDVIPGRTYKYQFVAVYAEGESQPFTVSCVVEKSITMPNIALHSRGNQFMLEIDPPMSSDFKLYAGSEKLRLNGRKTMASEVTNKLEELKCNDIGLGLFEFEPPKNSLLYIYPVITSGKLWTVGYPVQVSTYKDCEVKSAFKGDLCELRFLNMPEESIGIHVLVDSVTMPTSPENQCDILNRFYVRDELKERRYFISQQVGSGSVFVKVFSVYSDGANGRLLSEGLEIRREAPEPIIRYRFSSGFRGSSAVFESDSYIETIPLMIAIAANRGVPMSKNSGENLGYVGPVSMNKNKGSCSVNIPKDRFDNTLLFFNDPDNEKRFKLFKKS